MSNTLTQALTQALNHQVRLASRPSGMVTAANWQFTKKPWPSRPTGACW